MTHRAKQCIELNEDFEVNGVYTAIIDLSADLAGPFKAYYTIKDHLGNTRVVFHDENGDGTISQPEILQISNYYPFGAEHGNSLTGEYAYKFNGKEKELGLDLEIMRYGARNYDQNLIQFDGVDPLADQMPEFTPYHMSYNNPLRYVDPDGLAPEDIIITLRDPNGNIAQQVDYRNDGKLYNLNGSEYTGGLTEFTSVRDAINEARAADPRLDAMFENIENSPLTHEITNNDPDVDHNLSEVNRSNALVSSTIMQYSPDGNRQLARSKGEIEPTNADVMVHESKHVYDHSNGIIRSRNPLRHADRVPDAEVDAVNTNRILQDAQGRPLSTNHGSKTINKTRLKNPKSYNPLKD